MADRFDRIMAAPDPVEAALHAQDVGLLNPEGFLTSELKELHQLVLKRYGVDDSREVMDLVDTLVNEFSSRHRAQHGSWTEWRD